MGRRIENQNAPRQGCRMGSNVQQMKNLAPEGVIWVEE
jgi:hypothetical protein